MSLLRPISRLYGTNPFEPAWEALLKASVHNVWLVDLKVVGRDLARVSPEAVRCINVQVAHAVEETARKLAEGAPATPDELAVYHGAALYSLWVEVGPLLQRRIDKKEVDFPRYDEFLARYRWLFGHTGIWVPEPRRLLELYDQTWRAHFFIATMIRGRGRRIAAARAALWRAIIAGEICDYAQHHCVRMQRFSVLVTGETGSGKELAAQCIGWSSFIPFDEDTRKFAMAHDGDYHVRSLCESAASLVEADLFGFKRGSFTGATSDKLGYLALPQTWGTLFLDEIGEISLALQAKLLRPIQNRVYSVIGESTQRELVGRLVFATNRDLEAMCREGTFRRDLYMRLKILQVHMPALRDRLADDPDELLDLVWGFVEKHRLGPDRTGDLTRRAVDAIRRDDYDWPGNVRELENYVDAYVLTNGCMPGPAEYAAAEAGAHEGQGDGEEPPITSLPPTSAESSGNLGERVKEGEVPLEEVERDVVTHVLVRTGGNKAEAARRLQCTWRKIDQMPDPVRLERLLRRQARKKPGKAEQPKAKAEQPEAKAEQPKAKK